MIKKNLPSVAVVIPVYNGTKYLEEAIASAFNQTMPPSEVIVVDDGSTDDSYEFAERLRGRFPFRLLRKTNGGQGSARNFGFANTDADLVALLDQDDVWHPDHLELLAQPFAEDPGLGWSYSNMDRIFGDGGMFHHGFLDRLPHVPQPKTSIVDCISQNMFIVPSGALISKAAHQQVGGFDERLKGYEDDDLFLRLFAAGYKSAYIRKPLFKWRMHDQSTSYSFVMPRSRMLYARKLLGLYPDVPTMGWYFSRDLIAPRFFPEMVCQYLHESRSGRWENAEWALEETYFLSQKLKSKVRRRTGRVFSFLLHPLVRGVSRNRFAASLCRGLVKWTA